MTPKRFPPLPVFDWSQSQQTNVFAWIVRAAPKVRAQRLQKIGAEAVAKRVALQHPGPSQS